MKKEGIKKIFLDVDGVLANFYLAMCIRYNNPYKTLNSWSNSWINDIFHEIKNDKGFWHMLPVLNPPEAITFDIAGYVSACPEDMYLQREFWLKKNGFPMAPLYLTSSHDKVAILKKLKCDIYLDDRLENVIQLRKADINAILFEPTYISYANHSLVGCKDFVHYGLGKNDKVPYIKHIDQLNQYI